MRTWSNREKQRGVGLWMVLQMVMPDLARSLTTSTTCAPTKTKMKCGEEEWKFAWVDQGAVGVL